jgi:hypothetical protein
MGMGEPIEAPADAMVRPAPLGVLALPSTE